MAHFYTFLHIFTQAYSKYLIRELYTYKWKYILGICFSLCVFFIYKKINLNKSIYYG